jgi:hypothetical protein
MALAWAAITVGSVGLALFVRIYAEFGDANDGLWAIAFTMSLSAPAIAGLALWLVPSGRSRHDFAVGVLRVTLLGLVVAMLVLLMLLFALAMDP